MHFKKSKWSKNGPKKACKTALQVPSFECLSDPQITFQLQFGVSSRISSMYNQRLKLPKVSKCEGSSFK